MARSDKQLYDLLIAAECYIDTVNKSDKSKVSRRRQGETTTQPASRIGKVAWELGYRAWQQEQPTPIPPKPDPPLGQPWDSGYPPRAYNQGSRGQNCIFNIKINCVYIGGDRYRDKNGLTYLDSGLCDGGRTETPDIPGLKPADMKDQHEPWDSYEWFGTTIGPNKENYPADSYKQ